MIKIWVLLFFNFKKYYKPLFFKATLDFRFNGAKNTRRFNIIREIRSSHVIKKILRIINPLHQ